MEPIIPTFFCIGVLVWLTIREIRKWIEICVNVGGEDDSKTDQEPEMSESVKHMYN